MMRALLSVSDKTGLIPFAKALINLGFEIISTGGSAKALQDAGLNVTNISKITGVNELFGGRVKTLHPAISGGILYKRDDKTHQDEARLANIQAIDLVCVNLYPFKETTQKSNDFDEIIENIDIGGPTLLRAGAKNYKSVYVVCNPADYEGVIESLSKDFDKEQSYRQKLMIKAYEHTANYDAYIANYMNNRFNEGFGEYKFIIGKKQFCTKYGENPHQKGALYASGDFFTKHFKALKGEASFNNLTDINAALSLATSFGKSPCVAIIKHANACGCAVKSSLHESFIHALKCDNQSAYGGVVAINGKLDCTLAKKLNETFFELIIAASVDLDALEVFASKKRIKIFSQNQEYLSLPKDDFDYRHVAGGFVYQESDYFSKDEVANAKLVTQKKASLEEMQDMQIAMIIAMHTKSNNIIYVKDGAMVASGMGLTSRVAAVEVALMKASKMGLDLKGCVMASEAFLPFRDSLDEAAKIGVKALIQPGGSIRDEELIKAANEHGIAMYFTSKRHFLH